LGGILFLRHSVDFKCTSG